MFARRIFRRAMTLATVAASLTLVAPQVAVDYGGGPVYVAPGPGYGYYGGYYGGGDPGYGPGRHGYGTEVLYVNGHPIAGLCARRPELIKSTAH